MRGYLSFSLNIVNVKNVRKLMVTGGTGQLGGAVEALWNCDAWEDWQAVFPSRSDFDLSNEELVRGYIKTHQPNILLHAGAYTDVERAEDQKDLAFLVNAQANVWIAEECAKIGCWLIYISTDYVFDGKKGQPYDVTDAVNPLNVYGQSKLLGEKNALAIHHQTTVVRASWIYSTTGKNFFKTMLHLASSRDELNVVDDQFGAPTYALSLAGDLLFMMSKCQNDDGIYNRILHYSPQGQTTWFGFAKAILNVFYPEVKINPVSSSAFPQKASRPAYSKMSSDSWEQATGVFPAKWEEQLEKCINDWKNK